MKTSRLMRYRACSADSAPKNGWPNRKAGPNYAGVIKKLVRQKGGSTEPRRCPQEKKTTA